MVDFNKLFLFIEGSSVKDILLKLLEQNKEILAQNQEIITRVDALENKVNSGTKKKKDAVHVPNEIRVRSTC